MMLCIAMIKALRYDKRLAVILSIRLTTPTIDIRMLLYSRLRKQYHKIIVRLPGCNYRIINVTYRGNLNY